MSAVLFSLLPLALLAVVVVLGLGLWTMLRGNNPQRSQKLMRWRVALQFVAVVLLMVAIYFTRG